MSRQPKTPVAPARDFAFLVVPGQRIEDVKDQLIATTLDYCGGCKTLAARLLGIDVKTVYRRRLRQEEAA